MASPSSATSPEAVTDSHEMQQFDLAEVLQFRPLGLAFLPRYYVLERSTMIQLLGLDTMMFAIAE